MHVTSTRRSSNDSATVKSQPYGLGVAKMNFMTSLTPQIKELLDMSLYWDFNVFKLEELTMKRWSNVCCNISMTITFLFETEILTHISKQVYLQHQSLLFTAQSKHIETHLKYETNYQNYSNSHTFNSQ